MRPIKKADGIIFAEDKTEEAFNSLPEEDWLKKAIKRAIDTLKENVFSGEKIRKELIPKEYIQKYNIDNLFWYKLSKGWRLVYSVAGDDIEVLAIIIEYFDHKNYERRFKY
ncbi:hypothetical protein GF386_05235 [Candidatus Pacearchaeota archaeon]|nr:hypothetical protein [Candidatus Pacearchaeota archaeon]